MRQHARSTTHHAPSAAQDARTSVGGSPPSPQHVPHVETVTALLRPADKVRALHINGREYDYAPGAAAGMAAAAYVTSLASRSCAVSRLSGYVYCTIEAVGYGTATGMTGGAVPLVVLAAPDGTRVLVPARLVDVYAGVT